MFAVFDDKSLLLVSALAGRLTKRTLYSSRSMVQRVLLVQPVRTWKFFPDFVKVRTPLYGLYFSLNTWSDVMANPETDAIGT